MSFETEDFRNKLNQILSNYPHPLCLNASKSHHKWTMLCFEHFIYHDWPVFMVDKFTNQLSWLHEGSSNQDESLTCQIKVKEYLKAFNTQVMSVGSQKPEPKSSRALTEWLIDHIAHNDQSIARLNYMAMMADSNHVYNMRSEDLKQHKLQQVIEQFQSADKLKITGRKIEFIDESRRFYCNGGWLENHVFALLYGMRKQRPDLIDVNKSMQWVRSQGHVKNEIDVIAMHNNRLHIIECKTKKFGQSQRATQAANAVIYRLDTLKQLSGGFSARAMLVSYQPINQHTKQRAQDLGIYVCAHKQLKQLQQHLYYFLDQKD